LSAPPPDVSPAATTAKDVWSKFLKSLKKLYSFCLLKN